MGTHMDSEAVHGNQVKTTQAEGVGSVGRPSGEGSLTTGSTARGKGGWSPVIVFVKPPHHPDSLKTFQITQGHIVVVSVKKLDHSTPGSRIRLRRELILLLLGGTKKPYGFYGETFNL